MRTGQTKVNDSLSPPEAGANADHLGAFWITFFDFVYHLHGYVLHLVLNAKR
jgi:hypothetical protein